VVKAEKEAKIRSFTERIGGSNTSKEREQKEQNKKSFSRKEQLMF
jgi:hypothetical protein